MWTEFDFVTARTADMRTAATEARVARSLSNGARWRGRLAPVRRIRDAAASRQQHRPEPAITCRRAAAGLR